MVSTYNQVDTYMLETKSHLSRPLEIGRGRDGRCRYDPVAKQELVQSCLQPGISIARKALDHGVNANLLRKWIKQYQASARDNKADDSVPTLPAFVPVMTPAIKPQRSAAMLTITLVNGVQVAIQAVDLADLSPLLNTLTNLPCSTSTPG